MSRRRAVAALLVATAVLSACAGPPEAAADRYGAIALSQATGRVGRATDLATLAAADEAAVRYCAADDCATVVWFANGCAGVSRDGGVVAWALADDREEAEQAALRECGADNCRVVTAACTAR